MTKPIEEQIGSISGIKQISSSSIESVSVVAVEFNYGTNMDIAMANIREKLDLVKPYLPEGCKAPAASAVDPASSPIMIVSYYGNVDSKDLRTKAINDIKPLIEQIPGVGSVKISGGKERIIQVAVDKDKLESYNVSPFDVVSALKRENINLPSGKIVGKYQQYNIRSMGEFTDLKNMELVPISIKNGVPVFIRDVAKVVDSNKEITSISRFMKIDKNTAQKKESVECVTLDIKRNQDANVVKVADLVKERLNEINKTLPAGEGLFIVYDSSEYIVEAIHNLVETAKEGAILAILTLFLFLASIRSTFVISLSIPVSIIGTLLIMYFTNITINMITLTALILGIGRIVDDSIVVLENIFRYMEEGYSPFEAAIQGTKEVGLAVTASTFTTISVFFPLFLIQGIAGQIFTPLSKTFAYALLMSLLVAVTLIPMLSSRMLKNESKAKDSKNIIGKFLFKFNNYFEMLSLRYEKLLNWSLHNRKTVILIAVLAFIASLLMLPFIPLSMMEKWDRGDFTVNIETIQGTSIERTDQIIKEVEKRLTQKIADLKAMVIVVGNQAGQQRMSMSGGSQTHLGGMTVNVLPKSERKGHKSIYKIMTETEKDLFDIPGAKISVREVFSMTGKKALAINIKGPDVKKLTEIANDLMKKVSKIEELKNVDLNWRSGNPEYQLAINREKVAGLGLGYGNVATMLRQLVAEDKVSVFRQGGNEYDIIVQLPKDKRSKIADIMKMNITAPNGQQVPLSSIVDVKLTTGPSEIPRLDRMRYISVEGDIKEGATLSGAMKKINPIMKSYPFPAGYSWEIGGEEKQRQEIFGQMFTVLGIAILFVYIILAVQFESFIHPLTIMLSIPLELIGVFTFFLITRAQISMFGLLGIIMLTGIVVSNAILLVNYIIVLRGRGFSREEAVLKAGPVRLRPILMTAIGTVMAMIPLALGLRAGAEIFSNLAKGVIGGLITSTALTLIVVPVVYTLLDDLGPIMKNKLNSLKAGLKNRKLN